MPDVGLEGGDAGVDSAADEFVVIRPKKRSTWLTQDDPVGVKWTWKRGWRASQVLIMSVLWVA